MRLVIVGGVAAGATAAARARRISETAEIVLVERGPYISFANCGLPYFISRSIEKRSRLLLQTPLGFERRYNVKVLVDTEVREIDRTGKRIQIRGHEGSSWLDYDKLILAQGGNPIVPDLPGIWSDFVFTLWTVPDVDRLHAFIGERHPETAVIAGGGFIGLEMAEALHARGLKVTLVELLPQVMVSMDPEFGAVIKAKLESMGVKVETGVGIHAVENTSRNVELSDGRRLSADLVLLSVGVRPELTIARAAGLHIGEKGGLSVDEYLRTSDPDIYAAGDMVEIKNKVLDRMVRLPLAGPANRQGRIAAQNALGERREYKGSTATSIVKIFDMAAGSAGLTEKTASEAGFDVGTATIHRDHHAGYYPGAKQLTLKLVYDKKSRGVLGLQAVGEQGVDKRIDTVAAALQGHLTIDDLAELDLAYAPPFSSANDPLNIVAFVAQNDLSGFSPLIGPLEFLRTMAAGGGLVLDVRTREEFLQGHFPGSLNIPVDDLRSRLKEVPRDRRIFVHCKVGYRGHLALRILKENNYSEVWNISGGYLSMAAFGGFDEVKSEL